MYFLQESALFLQERPPAFIVTDQPRAGYDLKGLYGAVILEKLNIARQ